MSLKIGRTRTAILCIGLMAPLLAAVAAETVVEATPSWNETARWEEPASVVPTPVAIEVQPLETAAGPVEAESAPLVETDDGQWAAPKRKPQTVSNANSEPPAAIGSAQAQVHRVAAGETLFAISRRYQVPVDYLIENNSLTPPYHLRSGQQLEIPAGQRVVVATGDTLYGISRRYNLSVSQLIEENALEQPYRIRQGQVLQLPTSGKEATRTQVASSDAQVAFDTPAPKLRPKPVALVQPAARSSSKFAWPARGRVTAGFGPRAGGLHNDGINILAARGEPVLAAENGVVAYAGNELRGFGNLLLVKHADGWVTAYAHLEDFAVARGDRVARGQMIGRVGNSGHVVRPQLHFEIRKGTKAIDPQKYLSVQQAGLQ
jgi:murein DD-endopeptidase MepM/ murein hydrolase activator NlpD